MDVQPHLLNLSAYINQNLEKDLPLSSLAKRVGLSPFHFHRKFGAYFGESLHQHIKRLRLERAAFALAHGSLPVRQIARDSGYKTVSAFSHAFSGFAGTSPTRYRVQQAVHDGSDPVPEPALEPAWIGNVSPQDFAFVRAEGRGRGPQPSVLAALETLKARVGNGWLGESGAADDASADGERTEHRVPLTFIAATSDVYGISQTGEFRIDVGLEAGHVPPDKVDILGRQTLPGGRYARFDFNCSADEVLARCCDVSLTALENRGETPRLSQYFVRFPANDGKELTGERDYQFFMPLVG